jgi:chemotaxis protein methyltransferase CheR
MITPAQPKMQSSGLSADNLRFLCQTIYRESGIVLDESKTYLLEARLMPLAKDQGTGTLDGLCNLIRATGRPLRDRVVEALTTNETLFFRDIKPFDSIQKILFPELMKERGDAGRSLRVWCAACSTGQEPYSLAMLWLELAAIGWQLEILASDLSESVLEKARSGCFQQLEVNRGLPARYLVKYFQRKGMIWEIRPEVRQMIRWQKFNLKASMAAMPRFDLVMCRNVLIYFDLQTKRQIIGNIRKVLRSGGYLLLGSSETTLNIDENYTRKQVGAAIFYQNP